MAAAYLDAGKVDAAEKTFGGLFTKARTPGDHALLAHLKARLAFCNSDLTGSETILKKEIEQSRNVIHNLGFLANVELALFDQNEGSYPATAEVALATAEDAVKKLGGLDPDNQFIEKLRVGIGDRRKRFRW